MPVTPFGDKNRIDVEDDEEPEDVEEGQDPVHTPMSSSPVSPTHMMHSQSLQSHDPGDYYRLRPTRINNYREPQLEDHNPFADGSYLSRGFQPESPSHHDPNRRAFPSSTYSGPQNMYDLQGTMVSNGPIQPNYYMSHSPQSVVPQSASYQVPPLMPQQGLHLDMPSGRYDSTPTLGNQLRTGSLHHPHHVPEQFQDYLQDEHNVHSG